MLGGTFRKRSYGKGTPYSALSRYHSNESPAKTLDKLGAPRALGLIY